MSRLSTEFAVFAAFTATTVDDGAAVYLVTGEFLANFVGHGAQNHGVLVANVNQVFSFLSSNILAIQYLVGQSDNFFHSYIHIPKQNR